jgi:hypothetical protein
MAAISKGESEIPMKRVVIAAVFCLGLIASHVVVWAWPSYSLKITPYGVDYPLIRPMPYSTPDLDPYERSFGIRRWLHYDSAEITDFKRTYAESRKWLDLYGGYGVLGNGEAVFTNAAAAWRRAHRGR